MFFRLPARLDFSRTAIDNGDLGFTPKTDVQPIARLVQYQSVRIRILGEWPFALDCPVGRIEFGNRMANDVRHPECLPIICEDQSRWCSTLPITEGLWITDLNLMRQQSVGVIESIDDVIPAAADKQRFSIAGPNQSSKCFRHRNPANDLATVRFDGHDFVFAVAGMQNGNYRIGWVQFCKDREITQSKLTPGRFD